MKVRAFRTLARDWETFGQVDPLFGILSDPAKHGGRWDVAEFFRSGDAHVRHLFGILESLNIEIGRGACLDFGCGVGRLTVPLSERFERTVGVDVAPSMIERARAFHRQRRGCEFVVNRAADLRQFPAGSFDFVHSCLVLQHIEPEISLGYVKEFFRVARPGGLVVFQLPAEKRTESAITASTALPDGGYAARIVIHAPPSAVERSQTVALSLTVTNASTAVWRHDLTAGRFLTVANHWLREDGTTALHDDGRVRLPRTLAPGESVDVALPVTTPAEAGRYLVEVDMVQEAVCWFAQKGSPTARASMVVTSDPLPVAGPSPPPAAPSVIDHRSEPGPSDDPPGPGVLRRLLAQLRPTRRRPTFSMHTIPRSEVEATIRDSGGRLLEAIDDNAAGAGWQSYTYVCRLLPPDGSHLARPPLGGFHVNRRTYGWVAGVIGAGVGTWLWRRMMAQLENGYRSQEQPFSERGTVIFANTPKPSETEFAAL
jgi:SAM-dependent methyltransferase